MYSKFFTEMRMEMDKTWIKIAENLGVDAEVLKVVNDTGNWEELFRMGFPLNIENGDFEMARKKAVKKSSPFTKGRVEVKKGGGTQFIGLKPDDAMVFAPLVGLDELVSANMHEYWDLRPAIFHPCIGRDCPGCKSGNEARFKGYLPVVMKDKTVHIYPFTISVYNQLEELEDELDGKSVAGHLIKFSRKGSGMATRYTIMGIGKRIDIEEFVIPDFIDNLGPSTKATITDLLEQNNVDFGIGPSADDDEEEAKTSLSEDSGDEDWGDDL